MAAEAKRTIRLQGRPQHSFGDYREWYVGDAWGMSLMYTRRGGWNLSFALGSYSDNEEAFINVDVTLTRAQVRAALDSMEGAYSGDVLTFGSTEEREDAISGVCDEFKERISAIIKGPGVGVVKGGSR